MKNIKIMIPDMQSAHCQLRVANALNTLEGVTINSIQHGMADITILDENQQEEALAVIRKAGYTPELITSEMETSDPEKTFRFKTNIKCSGCIAQVTPELNAAEGVGNWEVDLESKDKVLSVQSEGITEKEVMDAVKKAGFTIELLNN
jgi:copper chaperone CopZ